MKNYLLQKEDGDGWETISPPSQSIKYVRGLQDGIQWMRPEMKTRIVEVRSCKLVSVRVCHMWKPF